MGWSLRMVLLVVMVFTVVIALTAAPSVAGDVFASGVATVVPGQAGDGGGSGGGGSIMINPLFWGLPLIFLFLWVYTTNWASIDAQELEDAVLEYRKWNPILVFTFVAAWMAHYLIPIFWVGFPLVVLGWLVPILVYCLGYRNPLVEDHQKVLTSDHLRFWFATHLKIGTKERVDPRDLGPVKIVPASKDSQENTTRNFAARESVGYIDVKQFLVDLLSRRADAVMLDFTAESVSIRYLVDGLWAAGESLPREQGDAILEAIKLLCGMNPEERRAKQSGKFIGEYTVFRPTVFTAVDKAMEKYRKERTTLMMRKLAGGEMTLEELSRHVKMEVDAQVREAFSFGISEWTPVEKKQLSVFGEAVARIHPDNSTEKRKCTVTVTSAGTQTGERVLMEVRLNKVFFRTLAAIGMRQKMEEKFLGILRKRTGIFCFCGPQGSGLRTMVNVSLEVADRLTREFVAIESEQNPYDPVENIEPTRYDPTKNDDPCEIMEKMFHREPDVMIMRDIPSKAAAEKLFEHSLNAIEGVISIRATDCFDAIFQLIRMGIPAELVADAVNGALNQKLVRKLCEFCREPFAPSQQMLAQLGPLAGKVE
ncbi:MAG: ATPase, T2SS/T4P/T4SS family, partial [Planctomycetia bacterium]|nr:ATPase, T2SS/T4P/T4SS family [Planctomycetia bacterium]